MKRLSIIATMFFVYFSLFAQTGCDTENKDQQTTNGQQGQLTAQTNTNVGNVPEDESNTKTVGDIQSKPVKINTKQFKELVFNYEANPEEWVFEGDLPTIVDFYADWCKPCKMIAPTLEELQKEYAGKIRVYKVNTDENKELSSFFQIRGIPAILFIPMEGQPQMASGALPKESFEQAIKDVLKVKKAEAKEE